MIGLTDVQWFVWHVNEGVGLFLVLWLFISYGIGGAYRIIKQFSK